MPERAHATGDAAGMGQGEGRAEDARMRRPVQPTIFAFGEGEEERVKGDRDAPGRIFGYESSPLVSPPPPLWCDFVSMLDSSHSVLSV